MEYSFEIIKYDDGQEMTKMCFQEGFEILTQFLFVCATSREMADNIIDKIKSVLKDGKNEVSTAYNGFDLFIKDNYTVITREDDRELQVRTEELLEVMLIYYRKLFLENTENIENE